METSPQPPKVTFRMVEAVRHLDLVEEVLLLQEPSSDAIVHELLMKQPA
jgi:hypothetical protein